jgi:hypothetical protein
LVGSTALKHALAEGAISEVVAPPEDLWRRRTNWSIRSTCVSMSWLRERSPGTWTRSYAPWERRRRRQVRGKVSAMSRSLCRAPLIHGRSECRNQLLCELLCEPAVGPRASNCPSVPPSSSSGLSRRRKRSRPSTIPTFVPFTSSAPLPTHRTWCRQSRSESFQT